MISSPLSPDTSLASFFELVRNNNKRFRLLRFHTTHTRTEGLVLSNDQSVCTMKQQQLLAAAYLLPPVALSAGARDTKAKPVYLISPVGRSFVMKHCPCRSGLFSSVTAFSAVGLALEVLVGEIPFLFLVRDFSRSFACWFVCGM